MFEKLPAGDGYQFISKIVGGSIPKEYIPVIKKAIAQISKMGVIAGYPLIDFKATLIDGSYHDVDSSAIAFEVAAKSAFREGMKHASPILLEPIMSVEIITTTHYIGDVIGHLSSIRGQVLKMESSVSNNAQIINAMVPLASMFGYVSTLRSITHGRAQYSMRFSNYKKVPHLIASKIINEE